MNDFDWGDHPVVSDSANPGQNQSGTFSWDDHPVVQQSSDDGILATISKKIDSYTGAPTRAAIAAMQKGDNPIPAFGQQFGEDPSKAPGGEDIAKTAGASTTPLPKNILGDSSAGSLVPKTAGIMAFPKTDLGDHDISPAQIAGAGINLAADPTLLIPGIAELRGAKEAGAAAETTGLLAKTADKLKTLAETAAENATGATGKQVSAFKEGAGRELLDRGLVSFGDSQKQIAGKVTAEMNSAYNDIDSSLNALNKNGVTVDANAVYNTIRDKITELRKDESTADVADHLEKQLNNVIAASDARASSGEAGKYGTDIPISQAEATKRGYNRQAGNWQDPEKGMAGKEMYQAYRGAVEDAAKSADPAVAAKFEEGKKTYSLLAPIQEAAERRANTTQQHAAGGFLDVVSSMAGESAGGPAMAIGAPVARRLISPRIASSVAVTADKAADLLRKVPQFADLEAKRPIIFKALVSHLAPGSAQANAADNSKPTKGPDKWAADGFDNLLQHVGPTQAQKLQAQRDQLMKSPSQKQKLINASDLTPGSKAMNSLYKSIKGGS